MGRRYKCPIPAIGATAQQDIWELLAPSDATVLIWGIRLNQSSDIDSEQLRLTAKHVTGSPTSGSGGGTITPAPNSPGDAAFGGTVERNNTTRISGGTAVTKMDEGWNVL